MTYISWQKAEKCFFFIIMKSLTYIFLPITYSLITKYKSMFNNKVIFIDNGRIFSCEKVSVKINFVLISSTKSSQNSLLSNL